MPCAALVGRLTLEKTMTKRSIQSTLFRLALAVFAIAPSVLAQEQPLGRAPANWSQIQINEFNKLNMQGQILLQHRDYAKARSVLEQACKMCPTAVDVQSNLGVSCMNMGDNEEALIHFQQALTIEPDNAETVFNIGNCYLGLGNTKEGRVWLQKCIDSKTADPALRGDARATLETLDIGKWDMGLESSNKASADYFDNLVKTKMACHWSISKMPLKIFFEPSSAVQYYRPEFKTILVSAFNEWMAATGGKLSWVEIPNEDNANIVCKWQREPEKSLLEGGNVVPDLYDCTNGTTIIKHAVLTIFTMRPNPVGDGLLPIDDTVARHLCLHEVGHALGLGSHSPNKNDIMGVGLTDTFLTGLSTRDKNTIARLYTLTPTDEAGDILDQGVALIKQGSLTEARSTLEQACKLDPNEYSGSIHNDLGIVCDRLGDSPTAAKHYLLAIHFEPSDTQLLLNLGRCYQLQGKAKEAIEWFDKFIAKEPNDPRAIQARKIVNALGNSNL